MTLTFENIKKSFGEKQVLNGLNFTVEGGSAFGLLGRNGAGKTTAIRILMNVFPSNEGRVLLDGREIDYDKTLFGYLPEERGLYPKKKIFEQLVYFAELKGMSRADAVASCDYWLDRLGMQEYRNKRLDTLSKGNQQKIQLITAVAHNPDIVILDEPFSGLDPVNAMLLKSVVKEIINSGKIVLFSSHQMSYIEEFCDSIAIIHNGDIVLTGSLREIKRNYPRNKLLVSTPQAHTLIDEYGATPTEVENQVIITLSSPDKKSELMQELTAKYDIDNIMVYEPSLNDIFVEYAR